MKTYIDRENINTLIDKWRNQLINKKSQQQNWLTPTHPELNDLIAEAYMVGKHSLKKGSNIV